MVDVLRSPKLSDWAHHIERLDWSGMVCDDEWNVVWVSRSLKDFIGATDENVGIGLHIAEALVSEVWLRTVHPDSQVEIFFQLAPYLLSDFRRRGRDPKEILPEPLMDLMDQVQPAEFPYVWSFSFRYLAPTEEADLSDYRVKGCAFRLHDDTGRQLGWMVLFYMDVRPNLLSLLARGDQDMYERMARLVKPGPRQAAVLFCDLHRSVRLSRQLPSVTYFKLVRSLWTGIDKAVADETGIVGKHAGDGASAFFLVEDLGSASKAAAAAIRAARRIHEISEHVFRDVLESGCMMKIGLHWGGSLYMGQLVPGGRLDVTALGDEVNEAARLQETAETHGTLVSKQLIEQLTPED
ncbi:MAG: adenylate/guanylate cyclase domain-containing protein, partial [Actinomycetota bacterium]|nr:adenylate/guanylate cyclase domain-containing protein [Actinomycetota bacterium]